MSRELRRRPVGQRAHPEIAGQLREIGRTQSPDPDPGDPRVARDEPCPGGVVQHTCPSGDDRHNFVCAKPAQGKEDGARRRSVDPREVLDCDDDQLPAVLPLIEEGEQLRPDRDRVEPGLGECARVQLVDDPVGEQRLFFVAANLDHHGIR